MDATNSDEVCCIAPRNPPPGQSSALTGTGARRLISQPHRHAVSEVNGTPGHRSICGRRLGELARPLVQWDDEMIGTVRPEECEAKVWEEPIAGAKA
jgi:hypothetical protein